jgi:hypothetical protein
MEDLKMCGSIGSGVCILSTKQRWLHAQEQDLIAAITGNTEILVPSSDGPDRAVACQVLQLLSQTALLLTLAIASAFFSTWPKTPPI